MPNFTERAQRTLFFARYEATMAGATEVSPTHLVLGILREAKHVRECLSTLGLEPYAVRAALVDQQSRAASPAPVNQDLPLDDATARAVARAQNELRADDSARVEPLHLLVGVLADDASPVAQRLSPLGLTAAHVRAFARETEHGAPAPPAGTTTITVSRRPPGTTARRDLNHWELAGFTLRALIADVYEIAPARIDLPADVDGPTTYELHSTAPAGLSPEQAIRTMPRHVQTAIEAHFGLTTSRVTRTTEVQVLTAPDVDLRTRRESEFDGGGMGAMAFTVDRTGIPIGDLPRAALQRLLQGPRAINSPGIGNLSSISATMSMRGLCDFLERALGTIVIDDTALQGTYAIELRADEPGTMPDRLRAIGLVLTPASREIEYLVVTQR